MTPQTPGAPQHTPGPFPDPGTYAFLTGYTLGKAKRPQLSNRQIANEFPLVEPHDYIVFQNGWIDGWRGDTFRLRLISGDLGVHATPVPARKQRKTK